MDRSIDEIARCKSMASSRSATSKAARKAFCQGQNKNLASDHESLSLRHQRDVLLYARTHGGEFPSFEEESMVEVDYDDDDESCSSSEGTTHIPIITLDTLSSEDVTTAHDPLTTTIAVPPRSEVLRAIGLGALREASHAVEIDSPPTASTADSEAISSMRSASTSSSRPDFHAPRVLPKFRDPKLCMWTSSHAANCPSEDRSSSMVNVLLRPALPKGTSNTGNREVFHYGQ